MQKTTETMSGTPASISATTRPWRKVPLRIVTVLAAALLMGVLEHHVSAALNRSAQPAGFARGILQGALMPCAFPNLLVGNDVMIYSQDNTGISYKLGYTCGVNACGALFFGFFFWRLNRWRKRTKNGG